MTRKPSTRRGFKLSELIVVVLLVGVGLGVLLRALTAARESGRRTQCSNNERQLGLSLLNFATSKNRFPSAGTFLDDPRIHQGDPTRSTIYRSIVDPGAFRQRASPWLRSWVVDVMPYLDSPDEPVVWDRDRSYLETAPNVGPAPSNFVLSSMALLVLRCPSAPGLTPADGNLTYVANGGFVRWPAAPLSWSGGRTDGTSKNGAPLEWTPPARPWQESQAVAKRLGVMFLGTHTGDQPWDISTRPSDVTDGASTTLLLGENHLAGYSKGSPYSGGLPTNWACPLPNFCMFLGSDDVCQTPASATVCLSGQLQTRSTLEPGPGWALANSPKSSERINYGLNLTVKGSSPFVSSGHPGGVNFLFCDGAVRFVSETIDGRVYAQLITPAGVELPEALRHPAAGQSLLDALE